jgi:alpha-1,3-rhamnosyl/mannosyltransferase
LPNFVPIRILIDARKLGDGGIGVYIENLVDGLLALQDLAEADLRISLLVEEAFFDSEDSNAHSTHFRTQGRGALYAAAKIRWHERVRYVTERSPKYSLQEYFLLGLRQHRVLAENDIFHSPHFTLPYFLGIPSVVTVHDVIHCSHPESFYHRPIARMLLSSAFRRAKHIITVSEDSARSIREISRGTGGPISVIPNALRPELQRKPSEEVLQFRNKEFLTREYCLYVGSERAHKGFWELLDAWAELAREASAQRCPDLVVVGRQFSVARDRVHEMGLDTVVRFCGEVNLDKLALLYSGAGAVIVPSRVEGFGLPALEGMGLGVPVICAPIPSLREVCGEAAVYAADHSGVGIARAVRQVFAEPAAAAEKVQSGLQRARQFSVEKCARKTLDVYRTVLGIGEQSAPAASGPVAGTQAA